MRDVHGVLVVRPTADYCALLLCAAGLKDILYIASERCSDMN
jgi:hypothetical protein